MEIARLKPLQKRIKALTNRRAGYLGRYEGKYPTPAEFSEHVHGFSLDAWQHLYMDHARVMSRIGIAASRQSGKSTVTADFVAWCLVFIAGFRCLVASRSLRQASYFVQKVRQAVLSVIPTEDMALLNRLSLELPNGSFIVSIPCAQPDAGRGFDPHLVLIDEAAFAPEGLFNAIFPSVAATHGAVHMISSPNGRHGYFFNAFEGDAKEDVWTLKVPWTQCPRISEEAMLIEQRNMGMIMWRQEFNAEFIVPEGAFFGASAISQFEEGEEFDLTDLELADMEALLDAALPLPDPTVDDLRAAFDRTDRVRHLLYG